jgi:hypothetical protein
MQVLHQSTSIWTCFQAWTAVPIHAHGFKMADNHGYFLKWDYFEPFRTTLWLIYFSGFGQFHLGYPSILCDVLDHHLPSPPLWLFTSGPGISCLPVWCLTGARLLACLSSTHCAYVSAVLYHANLKITLICFILVCHTNMKKLNISIQCDWLSILFIPYVYILTFGTCTVIGF